MQNTLFVNKRVCLDIKDLIDEFKYNTYENFSQRALEQLLIQCFDNLDLNFQTFLTYISSLPNFLTIPDIEHITNEDKLVIVAATHKLYVGIYMLTISYGLRINDRFPYLLEKVYFNTCILYFDSSLTQPHFVIG